TPGEPILTVQGLTARQRHGAGRPAIEDISLTVHRGEIVALTGLIGSGASELLKTLWGSWPGMVSGTVTLEGRPVSLDSPKSAATAGLALVPGDRKEEGLVLSMTAGENLTLPMLRKISQAQVLDLERERSLIAQL